MDLNRAMANLYKQRSSTERSKQKPADNRPNHTPNHAATAAPPDTEMSIKDENHLESKKPRPTQNNQETTIETLGLNNNSNVTFDQLYGCDSARQQILRIINTFKNDINKGTTSPKICRWPVLIRGSRGLGKTSLVEAAANHTELKLIKIPVAKMFELSLNSRNKFIETLGHLIQHSLINAPALVLVDDLDLIADKEDYRHLISGPIRGLLAKNLLVFCAASSTVLESLRDLRFSCTIQMKRPSLEARYNILKNLQLGDENLSKLTEADLHALAMKTPSFTPVDLDLMLCFSVVEATQEDSSLVPGIPTVEHCEQAIKLVKESFKGETHLIGEKPSTTWADIGGMSSVRQAFLDILRQTQSGNVDCKFAGVALYGPPGCGKTMVAKAMANEAGFNYIPISSTQLVNKYLGETEKNIRQVFLEAREYEPCIIYFDEFDGLCGTRDNKDSLTNAIQTLLSEMDGFTERGQSIILVSTNRLDDIDSAIKRPGRLSKHIYIGPPDEEARRGILQVVLRGSAKCRISLASDVDLTEWAKRTDKFTGADLHYLSHEALRNAEHNLESEGEHIVLHQQNLDYAMKEIFKSNKELANRIKSHNSSSNKSVRTRARTMKRLKI